MTFFIGSKPRKKNTVLKPNIANPSQNYQRLEKHTQEFNEPKIISVCNKKIHVAIGYGLANAILLEGESGDYGVFNVYTFFNLLGFCMISSHS